MNQKRTHMLLGALALGVSYSIGSIPFGLWLTKLTRGTDVRDAGSNSTGTTNVLRTAGPGAAAATFGLDIGKGAAAVSLAKWAGLSPLTQSLCGVAAVAGHCWPAFADLRGGKGVATALGAAAAIQPGMAGAATVTACSVIGATRRVSAGSLAGVAAATLYAGYSATRKGSGAPLLFGACVLAIISIRHKENISRLLSGTEPAISRRHFAHRESVDALAPPGYHGDVSQDTRA